MSPANRSWPGCARCGDELRGSPQAAEQIVEIGAWWLTNRPKAPTLFEEELTRAFELLGFMPLIGTLTKTARPATRRLLLRGCRYHLYYVVNVEESAVEVLAIWHTARGRQPPL